MVAIDTNVLVRLIIRDDPAQTAAAERFTEKGAWVPVLALAKCTWVLASVYSLGASEIARAVEMLLDHRTLVLQEQETVAEALKLFRAKPALGFSDCLILQIAVKAGHRPLGTFDKALSKVDGAEKI